MIKTIHAYHYDGKGQLSKEIILKDQDTSRIENHFYENDEEMIIAFERNPATGKFTTIDTTSIVKNLKGDPEIKTIFPNKNHPIIKVYYYYNSYSKPIKIMHYRGSPELLEKMETIEYLNVK